MSCFSAFLLHLVENSCTFGRLVSITFALFHIKNNKPGLVSVRPEPLLSHVYTERFGSPQYGTHLEHFH